MKPELGPKLRELVSMMGRRADDSELIEWITTKLGKKAPTKAGSNVVAKKLGIELAFSDNVLNDKYPPIAKTKRALIPYLSHAWVREPFGEKVLGIDPKTATPADVVNVLGKPDGQRPRFMTDTTPDISYWHRVVDTKSDATLEIETDEDSVSIELSLASARHLEQFMEPSTHLFIAWAAENGLLDAKQFEEHSELFAKLKKRKALGSEFARAALPRGLWDSHLRDDEALRRTAYQWFHNLNDLWITKDLKSVFGKRKGPHGHDEPKLDTDSWGHVDAAAKSFKKVFNEWV